jgi:hypothetical protein
MSLHEFAKDLAHLEYVVPLLERGSPPSLPYWRNRVTALQAHQSLLPDGTKRVTRLLKLFAEFERMCQGYPGSTFAPRPVDTCLPGGHRK